MKPSYYIYNVASMLSYEQAIILSIYNAENQDKVKLVIILGWLSYSIKYKFVITFY
jgi:hypothetical protein